MSNLTDYQKRCFQYYKEEIGYDLSYAFLYGNPLNTLVPIETTQNKFMIVGAYPSAKFFTIKKPDGAVITDVPLYDNDSPFSNETYFDGSRVRTIPSGKELNDVILSRIGIKREDCWITDLVKVFLFKEGHVRRYNELGKKDIEPNRNKFKDYACKSIKWLIEEIDIANPKVIILLGVEVSSVLLNISMEEAKTKMTGEVFKERIKGTKAQTNVICLPHPGILMKPSSTNTWPERFIKEIAPTAKKEILNLF